MFNKFNSYAFLQYLRAEMREPGKDKQPFLLPITVKEKQWLLHSLTSPQSSLFLRQETIEKLQQILEKDVSVEQHDDVIMEKGRLALETDFSDISDLFRRLTRVMYERKAIKLEYVFLPLKLEYSLKTTQWFITGLWLENGTSILTIPLSSIQEVETVEIPLEQYEQMERKFYDILEATQEKAVIRLNRHVFAGHPIEDEKLRILYAFSGFDKEIKIDEEDPIFYEITLYYYPQDTEHLLYVIQLLGNRIEVLAPESLREKVKQTVQRAFARYHM